MVAIGSIIMMGVNALIGIAVPILLAWWITRKRRASWRSVLTGAGVFILFALILESLVHQVVLKGPHGPAILGNTLYYAIYGGLMAGLFEETGRFVCMKLVLRRDPSAPRTAVAYGIGHGGVEMLVIFGVTMVSNLTISVLMNAGMIDTILATVPEANRAQVAGQFAQLETLGISILLTGLWERFSAIVLQIGLSVIVWTAVRRGGRWLWLFPAAILLHALVDAVAVLLMKSASMLVTEIVVCAVAVAVAAIGWMLAKKFPDDAVPSAEAVPAAEAAQQPEAQ